MSPGDTGRPHRVRAALRCAAYLTIAACLAVFASWLVLAATTTLKKSEGIKENLPVADLSGTTVFVVLTTWAPLLLAMLLTLLIRRALPEDRPAKATAAGIWFKARRVLTWQLPPRGVWARWCGGLSVAEGCGVAAWLFVNAWWLGNLLRRSLEGAETWQDQLEKVALAFGKMMAPNLMLLFLPIPHCSFITHLTGVPRNHMIRYHRWLGHGTLWVLTLHATLYYLYWAVTHKFWVDFSDWGSKVNNLAGTLAWLCVLPLWLTSLEYVRRRMYQVFFRFHIISFLGFFLFSCAHYIQVWTYFAPGLLLYAADLALRAGQLANVTTVLAATVDERSQTATVQLQADSAVAHKPTSEVWLMVPQISRWQWHPFTVAGSTGSTLTLHIKQYGAFTKALLEGLRRRTVSAVRVSGPHGSGDAVAGCQLSPPGSLVRYDSVVMIGGGIGITALLSQLRHLAAQHATGRAACLPTKVSCVWVARSVGEFSALDAPLVLAATDPKGWLDLKLHVTGGPPDAAAVDDGSEGGSSTSVGSLPSCPSSTFNDAKLNDVAAINGAAKAAPAKATRASPFFWNRFRPVQPYSVGVAHLAAVHVLTYLGAFCAALLVASYGTQAVNWKAGMLYSVLVSAVAVALPFGLAVVPVHAVRYWRDAKAAAACGATCVVPYSGTGALLDAACAVTASGVRAGDALVPAQRGRPDLEAALRGAAAHAGAGVVGVYVGGPQGLMTAVHLLVCRLNAEESGTFFELHREAVEL